MNKYDILTKYIPMIQSDTLEKWFIDRENDGTPGHPIKMPFVDYSEIVRNFIDDVYLFEEQNKCMELNHYVSTLKDNGIEWNPESMKNADVQNLNNQCLMALILGAVRAERFCDGVLLDFFDNGYILKWLNKLNSFE